MSENLPERVAALEAKFKNLRPAPARSLNVTSIGNSAILLLIVVLYALIFTKLGEFAGMHAGWTRGPGTENTVGSNASTESVLAATRNMITILGPIFIGLAVWMVTVVAERRLKVYDEALEKQRQYLEDRADRNRDFLDQKVAELRRETREQIETGLKRAQESVESGSRDVVKSAFESEKEIFDRALKADKQILEQTALRFEELRKGIEERFGHIADNAGYARTSSQIGSISSVGSVHTKVTELFNTGKQEEATLLVRELLHLFNTLPPDQRPAGNLVDWFNLSAQLGRSDEDRLALEVTLAGLAQQNGARVFLESGESNWKNSQVPPDDDLTAHAIQYAKSIGSPLLSALLNLSGYNGNTRQGRKTWGWRTYNFALQALDSLGRSDEAIDLANSFMDNVPVSNDTSKVVQSAAAIIHRLGDQEKAVTLLKNWLQENPRAAAAQICTTLLDWLDGTGQAHEIVEIASRGIRDLAEEQASANLGNLYYRRALARDKEALSIVDSGDFDSQAVARLVSSALRDYEMARKVGVNPGVRQQLSQRVDVLIDLTERLRAGTPDLSEVLRHAPLSSAESVADRFDFDSAQEAVQSIIDVALNHEGPDSERHAVIVEILRKLSPSLRDAVGAFIKRLAGDDATPMKLRSTAQSIVHLLQDGA